MEGRKRRQALRAERGRSRLLDRTVQTSSLETTSRRISTPSPESLPPAHMPVDSKLPSPDTTSQSKLDRDYEFPSATMESLSNPANITQNDTPDTTSLASVRATTPPMKCPKPISTQIFPHTSELYTAEPVIDLTDKLSIPSEPKHEVIEIDSEDTEVSGSVNERNSQVNNHQNSATQETLVEVQIRENKLQVIEDSDLADKKDISIPENHNVGRVFRETTPEQSQLDQHVQPSPSSPKHMSSLHISPKSPPARRFTNSLPRTPTQASAKLSSITSKPSISNFNTPKQQLPPSPGSFLASRQSPAFNLKSHLSDSPTPQLSSAGSFVASRPSSPILRNKSPVRVGFVQSAMLKREGSIRPRSESIETPSLQHAVHFSSFPNPNINRTYSRSVSPTKGHSRTQSTNSISIANHNMFSGFPRRGSDQCTNENDLQVSTLQNRLSKIDIGHKLKSCENIPSLRDMEYADLKLGVESSEPKEPFTNEYAEDITELTVKKHKDGQDVGKTMIEEPKEVSDPVEELKEEIINQECNDAESIDLVAKDETPKEQISTPIEKSLPKQVLNPVDGPTLAPPFESVSQSTSSSTPHSRESTSSPRGANIRRWSPVRATWLESALSKQPSSPGLDRAPSTLQHSPSMRNSPSSFPRGKVPLPAPLGFIKQPASPKPLHSVRPFLGVKQTSERGPEVSLTRRETLAGSNSHHLETKQGVEPAVPETDCTEVSKEILEDLEETSNTSSEVSSQSNESATASQETNVSASSSNKDTFTPGILPKRNRSNLSRPGFSPKSRVLSPSTAMLLNRSSSLRPTPKKQPQPQAPIEALDRLRQLRAGTLNKFQPSNKELSDLARLKAGLKRSSTIQYKAPDAVKETILGAKNSLRSVSPMKRNSGLDDTDSQKVKPLSPSTATRENSSPSSQPQSAFPLVGNRSLDSDISVELADTKVHEKNASQNKTSIRDSVSDSALPAETEVDLGLQGTESILNKSASVEEEKSVDLEEGSRTLEKSGLTELSSISETQLTAESSSTTSQEKELDTFSSTSFKESFENDDLKCSDLEFEHFTSPDDKSPSMSCSSSHSPSSLLGEVPDQEFYEDRLLSSPRPSFRDNFECSESEDEGSAIIYTPPRSQPKPIRGGGGNSNVPKILGGHKPVLGGVATVSQDENVPPTIDN